MKVLNKAQVDELFRREAVLLGTKDVVPDFRAAALFGEDAVKSVESARNAGREWNICGDVTCLSYRGFLAAASSYNARQLQESTTATANLRILPFVADERRAGV